MKNVLRGHGALLAIAVQSHSTRATANWSRVIPLTHTRRAHCPQPPPAPPPSHSSPPHARGTSGPLPSSPCFSSNPQTRRSHSPPHPHPAATPLRVRTPAD